MRSLPAKLGSRGLAIVALVAALAIVAFVARGAVPKAPAARVAATASPATVTTSSPSPSPLDVGGGAGGKNIVQVINQTDNRLRVAGRVQLNTIPGATDAAVNLAGAYSSCTNCTTLAVALQINLVSSRATTIVPQNAATAVNYACSSCDTVAVAYQYNIGEDDPTQVPPEVRRLVTEMQVELAGLQSATTSVQTAEQRVDAVISQFSTLAAWLITKRSEETASTSPNATALPPPAPATTATPSPATGSPSPTPGPSNAASPSPTPTVSPSSGPSPPPPT